ncbi:MAG TPA: hypothetical protein DF712_19455, partial [Balneola sp.]|nr:hypothetical protein [Balneola sp.]
VVVTGDLVPAADDTYDLGTSGAAWQDLFLEGDITLTDAGSIATSAGDLTITANAGSNDVVVTGDLIPAADDTYDLGTTTAAWQDLHLEGNILMTDAGSIETAAGDLTIKTTQSGASKVILSGSSADDSVLVQSDMQVDGNLYAKDAVVLELGKKINLNGAGSNEFITCPRVGSLRIDANNHAYITSDATLQFDIQNQLILSASLIETVINQGGNSFDFRVESNNLQGAILIDGGTDQVILGTNKTNAAGESLGTDVNILMSGSIGSKGTATKGTSVFSGDAVISGSLDVNTVSITTDGKVGIGTSNPSYKLEVGGNAAFGEYLYHRGDTDTFIQFADDAIGITAGGEQLITVTEAGQDIVKIGDGGDVDFQVRTNGDDNTIYVRGDTDRVGIGTNAPVSVLHIKELSPTVSIQRENNSNDSTIAFLGASGFTGAIMHLSSSNDLVFKTHDGSSPQEIMRLGGHYASDVRQVIMLSGSDMHPGAMHPKNKPDINFFVSGSVGSKQMSQRGTAVLGGDAVVSGTLHIEQSIRDQSTKIKFADGSKTYLNVPGSNVFDISGDITRIGPDMSEVSMYMPADACLFVSGAIGARGGANRKISVFGGDVLVSGSFRAKKLYKKSLGWHVSINSPVPRFPGSYNDGMGGSATSGDVEAFFTTFGSGSLKALDLWVSENSTATCNIGFYKNSVDTPSAHCSGSFVSNNQILGLGGRGHLYVDFESVGLVSGSVNFNPGDMLTITIAKGGGDTFTKVNGTLIYEMDEDKLETNLLAGSLI